MASDSIAPCRFGYVEYDGDRYCHEHGGFAAFYGPHPNRCDRAPSQERDK